MQFLNPLYLLGLFAALVPFIIHLLNLRKNKIVEFSTLRFLNELQKSQIRRLRLKQILLLILRTGLIISIVLSFSRPVVRSKLPILGTYSNVSVVLIIDNSISNDVSDESGNRFRQVKKLAQSILDRLSDGDEVCVIFTTERGQHPSFTQNLSIVSQNIARSQISIYPSSFETAFRIAQKQLAEAKNFVRQIFVISDFQKSSLIPFSDSTKFFDENTQVNFLSVGANSKLDIQNISIDSVFSVTKIFEKGKFSEFEVLVHNRSERSYENIVLSLFYNNERVAQRSFDLKPKEEKNISIGAKIDRTGAIDSRFEIETDAFDYDNRRWTGFIVPNPPEVALLTNNTSSFLSKYLIDVLQGKISLQIISPQRVASANLEQFSVLIIESTDFGNEGWLKIAEFVGSGRGILLFPNSAASPIEFRNGFSNFGIDANFEIKTFPSNNRATVTAVDKNHPLLIGVYKTTESKATESFSGPTISRAMFTRMGEPIILTNAGSLVSEIKSRSGRIIYVSVTASNDWSNFPLSSLFPIVVYRSILYLSSIGEVNYFTYCGEQLNIQLPKYLNPISNFEVVDPLANKEYLQPVNLPTGKSILLDRLVTPGTYKIQTSNGNPIATISANFDPREFDLNLATESEILDFFSKVLKKNVAKGYIRDISKIDKLGLRAQIGSELWKLFVVLAILFAFAEMLVARTSKSELTEISR